MKTSTLLVTVVFLLGGCRSCVPMNPTVGWSLQKEGDAFVFHFRNCPDPSRPIGIGRITVRRQGSTPDQSPPYCEIKAEGPSGDLISEKWDYGTIPTGYVGAACLPLKSGEAYIIEISGAGGGLGTFAIDTAGSITTKDRACTISNPYGSLEEGVSQ